MIESMILFYHIYDRMSRSRFFPTDIQHRQKRVFLEREFSQKCRIESLSNAEFEILLNRIEIVLAYHSIELFDSFRRFDSDYADRQNKDYLDTGQVQFPDCKYLKTEFFPSYSE